jgi:Zn-dependent M16 (insulinase) family peptidase
VLHRETQHAMFPDNTYGVDSGGDPRVIPQLTFEQFKDFHAKYYHPTNSRIYFYGNDDTTQRLNVVDEYLSLFDKQQTNKLNDSSVKFQRKWSTAPKTQNVLVPFVSDSKQAVTINWLLNDENLSGKDMLALAILDHLLMGTPSSSLRKALTDSQVSRVDVN